MKVYVHLKTFDGRAKFSTWLTRSTINSALMSLRRRRTRAEISMDLLDGETRRSNEIADRKKNTEDLLVQHETAEHLEAGHRTSTADFQECGSGLPIQ